MATVQDVVLELTNNRNFYEAFTCVLRTAYENKYNYTNSFDNKVRRDLRSEMKRYYPDCYNNNTGINSAIIAELVSHYSEEVFGFYVPQDQALDFMTNGWELATHKQMTPFQKMGWTSKDRFKSESGRIVHLKRDDGTDMPEFHVKGERALYLSLDDLTKIDEPDQAVDSYLEPLIDKATEILNKTKQENTMKPSNIIKTKIIVFGDDAADMTNDQLFNKVQQVEAEIERLDSVKNKPKKLEARIAEMKAQLNELIKYIDSRD